MSKILILVHLLIASMESFIEEKFMHTHTPLEPTIQAQILGDDGVGSCASLQAFKALFPPPCKPSQALHASKKNAHFSKYLPLARFGVFFALDMLSMLSIPCSRTHGASFALQLAISFLHISQSFNGELGSNSLILPQISYEAPLSLGDHLPST